MPTPADRVFVVANSMREVQPEINLLVSPSAGPAGVQGAGRQPRTGTSRRRTTSDRRTRRGRRRRRTSTPVADRRVADLDPIADVEAKQAQEPQPGRVGPPLGDALHQRHRRDRRPAAPLGDAARPGRLGARSTPAGPGRSRSSSSRDCSSSSGPTSAIQVTRAPQAAVGPEELGHAATTAIDLGHPRAGLPAVAALHRLQPARARSPHELFDVSRTSTEYRPDQAQFVHEKCKGWAGDRARRRPARRSDQPAVPARYLIACVNGHLDEFPYVAWVHRGKPCPKAQGPAAADAGVEEQHRSGRADHVHCPASAARDARGHRAEGRATSCRAAGDGTRTSTRSTRATSPGKLMMLGAANQWFSSTVGLLALPREEVATVSRPRAGPAGPSARGAGISDRRRTRSLRFRVLAADGRPDRRCSTTSTTTCCGRRSSCVTSGGTHRSTWTRATHRPH